jgi:hypothetical protein
MFSAAAGFAGGAAVKAALNWRQSFKSNQILDPIAIICTLALRTLNSYEGSKPAVTDNCFYYDKKGIFQWIARNVNFVSHEDVGYLPAPIRLFIKHWKASEDKNLVEIVNQAKEGLTKIKDGYGDTYPNVKEIIKNCTDMLSDWLTGTSVDEMAETDEAVFITAIKQIWTAEKIMLFYHLHRTASGQEMELLLQSQRKLHLVELKRDRPTPATSSSSPDSAAGAAAAAAAAALPPAAAASTASSLSSSLSDSNSSH